MRFRVAALALIFITTSSSSRGLIGMGDASGACPHVVAKTSLQLVDQMGSRMRRASSSGVKPHEGSYVPRHARWPWLRYFMAQLRCCELTHDLSAAGTPCWDSRRHCGGGSGHSPHIAAPGLPLHVLAAAACVNALSMSPPRRVGVASATYHRGSLCTLPTFVGLCVT